MEKKRFLKFFLTSLLLIATLANFSYGYTIEKTDVVDDIKDNVDIDTHASISIQPSNMDFLTIPEDCESVAVPFAVYNDGGTPVYIRDVDIVGDDRKDFKIVDENCKHEKISVDDFCIILVKFAPKSEGSKEATLRVSFFDYDKIDEIDWKWSWDDLLDEITSTEDASLKGYAVTNPASDIFDIDCPTPPEYDIEDFDKSDGGSDNWLDIGCSMGSVSSVPFYLLVPFLVGLRRFFKRD
jgi:hypothetical protein